MIQLFRPEESSFADEIEQRLQDLVLAHEVHIVEDGGETLPLVRSGGEELHGRDPIEAFLNELTGEVMTGRQMQSDSCVLDPDHPSRCL